LGTAGPLFSLAKIVAPSFVVPRYPVKFLVLVGFALPLLAAYGLTVAGRAVAPKRVSWILAVILGIAAIESGIGGDWVRPQGFWLNTLMRLLALGTTAATVWQLDRSQAAGRPNRNGLLLLTPQLALLCLLWLDFRFHLPNRNPVIPAHLLNPTPSDLSHLPRLGEGRAYFSPDADEVFQLRKFAGFADDISLKRRALTAGMNLIDDVPKLDGFSTIQLRHQHELEVKLLSPTNRNIVPVIDFLAVTHKSSPTNTAVWVPQLSALPLVTAGQMPVLRPTDETLNAVLNPAFAPATEVVLCDADTSAVATRQTTKANVSNLTFQPQRVSFHVQADAPTLAVIAQSFYPRWQATVGGRPAPVLRANHAFQAVPVPAGSHDVVLTYVDRAFHWGALISAFTAVGCFWLWFRSRRT
jgi:hypothetical protein